MPFAVWAGSYWSGAVLRTKSAAMNNTAGKINSTSAAAMERRDVFMESLIAREVGRDNAFQENRVDCDSGARIEKGGRVDRPRPAPTERSCSSEGPHARWPVRSACAGTRVDAAIHRRATGISEVPSSASLRPERETMAREIHVASVME